MFINSKNASDHFKARLFFLVAQKVEKKLYVNLNASPKQYLCDSVQFSNILQHRPIRSFERWHKEFGCSDMAAKMQRVFTVESQVPSEHTSIIKQLSGANVKCMRSGLAADVCHFCLQSVTEKKLDFTDFGPQCFLWMWPGKTAGVDPSVYVCTVMSEDHVRYSVQRYESVWMCVVVFFAFDFSFWPHPLPSRGSFAFWQTAMVNKKNVSWWLACLKKG